MVAWVGSLDGRLHANEQATSSVKEEAVATKEATNVHFGYIKESLARIETKIDSELDKEKRGK